MIYLVLIMLGSLFILFILAAIQTAEDNKLAESLEKAVYEYDIEKTLSHTQPDKNVYVLDKENEEITYLVYNNLINTYSPTSYLFEDIIEVSLIVDGETITNTSRGSQIGGALVGGVLAGGAGAVIGGLSGKTTSKESISKISLKILMSNNEKTIKTITFLDVKKPILKNSSIFKNAFDKANEWEGQLKVILHEGKKSKDENVVSNNNNKINSNIADEIKKLHTLVEDGILTNEEFALQKEKILSK
ncbi:SHOCT domain-containing protein [Carnobacterium sp. FSL W8-0810]|uniref:SHOCT domain-containing protein n=1 Tax=Carnobacterium sp. FSL W8-0810 TaxID=2954705 RepID=UPI0030F93D6B